MRRKVFVLYLGMYDIYFFMEWSYLIYLGYFYLDDKIRVKYFLILYICIGFILKYIFQLFFEKLKYIFKIFVIKKQSELIL